MVLQRALRLVVMATALIGNLASPGQPGAVTSLSRWPYVQNVTATSATIAWMTATPGSSSSVWYGTEKSCSQGVRALDRGLGNEHYAVLTGLQPGTRYYYCVNTDGNLMPSSTPSFTTATTGNSFTFIAFGDSRGTTGPSSTAQAVANQINQWSFDLLLHDGDFVNTDSSPAAYDDMFFDVFQNALQRAPLFPAIGNHEIYDAGRTAYLDNFFVPQNGPAGLKGYAYSFDWGNAHFTVVDTVDDFSRGSAQYNWLQNDLSRSTKTWKVVLTHDPAYSSGQHGSNAEVHNILAPLFEANKVDLVFSGHDHDYERTRPMYQGHIASGSQRGVTYVVTGGGGAPLYDVVPSSFTASARKVNHFTRTTIQGCVLNMQAIDTNGSVFDTYNINKCIYFPMVARGKN